MSKIQNNNKKKSSHFFRSTFGWSSVRNTIDKMHRQWHGSSTEEKFWVVKGTQRFFWRHPTSSTWPEAECVVTRVRGQYFIT